MDLENITDVTAMTNQAQEQVEADIIFRNPQTREEMRADLEEDNRMTYDEIEEWLDSLEM